MRNNTNLTNKSKAKEAGAISNVLAHEPIRTEQATLRRTRLYTFYPIFGIGKGFLQFTPYSLPLHVDPPPE
jgi:hypothetical protein